jgi:hypothetical protein
MKNTVLVAITSAVISVSVYRIGFEKPQAIIAQEKCSNNSIQKSLAREDYKPTVQLQSVKEASKKPSTAPISHLQESSANSEQGRGKEEELEALKLEKKAGKFTEWLKDAITEDPNFDVGDYLSKHLSSEKIDSTWASEHESNLASLLRDNKNFSGIAVKDINCYSTYCKVSLSAANQVQADEILSKTSRTLYESKQPSQVIAAPNISNSATTLYIARYDNSFDFHK